MNSNKPERGRSSAAMARDVRVQLLADSRTLERFATRLAGRAPTVAAVHEARVALRRTATLLRWLGDDRHGRAASQTLRELARRLGPARDLTVWNELLASKKISGAMNDEAGWERFLATEKAHERRAYERLFNAALRKSFAPAAERIRSLAREVAAKTARTDAEARIERKIGRLLDRVDGRIITGGKLHDVRRRMRRLRYLAELFDAWLPPRTRRMARRLHRIETRLGKLHDLDLAIERVRAKRQPVARSLARVLARRRKKKAARIVKKF